MVGSRLWHYTVDAPLGQGGMRTVCCARDTVLNRSVALKILSAAIDDAFAALAA